MLQHKETTIQANLLKYRENIDRESLDKAIDKLNKIMKKEIKKAYKEAVNNKITLKTNNTAKIEKDSIILQKVKDYTNNRPKNI